jgi:hypothetical protein
MFNGEAILQFYLLLYGLIAVGVLIALVALIAIVVLLLGEKRGPG